MRSFLRRNGIPLILFFLVCLVGFTLSPSIGPAWDEPDNIVAAGRYILFFQKRLDPNVLFNPDWKLSYFGDTVYTQNPEITHYPPVPNYVGGALTLAARRAGVPLTATNIIIVFHIATVLFLALLIATIYNFARLIGLSKALSAFAAIVTFLYPTIFGHGLSNLKDTAQMTLFTLSLYLLVKGTIERIRHDIVLGAIVWGLALASKVNAVFVPIIWTIWMLVVLRSACRGSRVVKVQTAYHPSAIFSQGRDDASKRHASPHGNFFLTIRSHHPFLAFLAFIIGHLSLVIAIGFATAFLVWPVLWFDPIKNGAQVIHYFTTIGQGYEIYWNGALYQAGEGTPLWWYPWANILLITPPLLLLTVLFGVGRWITDILKRRKEGRFGFLLILWIVIPFARSFMPGVAFYDGIRHFMETLPALTLLAAWGLAPVAASRFLRVGGVALGLAVIAHLLYINTLYFPYSTGYFNMLARDPNTHFDRDIEGLSVKEGVDWVGSHYSHPSIAVPVAGHLSWYYLPGGSRFVYTMAGADTVVVANKSSHILSKLPGQLDLTGYKLVYMIVRGDAVFGWVYRKQ